MKGTLPPAKYVSPRRYVYLLWCRFLCCGLSLETAASVGVALYVSCTCIVRWVVVLFVLAILCRCCWVPRCPELRSAFLLSLLTISGCLVSTWFRLLLFPSPSFLSPFTAVDHRRPPPPPPPPPPTLAVCSTGAHRSVF